MSGNYNNSLSGGVLTPDQIALIVYAVTVGINALVCIIMVLVALLGVKKKYKKFVKECKESKKAAASAPASESEGGSE